MNIEQKMMLQLFIVVALCLGSVWAQNPSEDTNSKQTMLAAAKVPGNPAPSGSLNVKDMDEFVIGSEDVIAIDVWKEPEVSHQVAVRSDGKISLPLIGEVQASGKTPKQLETEIASGLKSYLSNPEVTVIVQAINSKKYSILGRVSRPGSYPLASPMTILAAIAASGGCQDFAKRTQIYVLRTTADGHEQRIPFNYKQVIKGKNSEQNIMLQPHDTIVVP
jgi:polysaccharide biosynthesis/export protein